MTDVPHLAELARIVARLRAPDGCPWDRAQTLHSMKGFLLEETYEVLDAVDSGDPNALREELGDLLLNVTLCAQMARERGWFELDDAAKTICAKMLRRHPHVFGDEEATSAEQVEARWTEIKAAEGRSALEGVPRALPALLRAERIGRKASRVGFDWVETRDVVAKVDEELAELREAMEEGRREAIAHELGDVLFAVAQLGRHLGVDPEDALRGTVDRFSRRFGRMEGRLGDASRMRELGLDELDRLWEVAKAEEAEERSA